MKGFYGISDHSPQELQELLQLSADLKALYKSGKTDLCLSGKVLAMIFEKMSLRTRMSFEVAMRDLGGSAIYIKPDDIGIIGEREPAKDIARVMSRYVDGIMARTFAHATLLELAKYADVPVINALSDHCHPCQAMADLLTIQEHCETLSGLKIAFIGDGNNVARSLAYACAKFGMKLAVASPVGYELDNESIQQVNAIQTECVVQTHDPTEAVNDAAVIYTDTWVSMGQEQEKQERVAAFQGFALDEKLISHAPTARIMHCLPAYRGYEITDEVAESPHSIIFDQAENRLHFQRALLKKLLS